MDNYVITIGRELGSGGKTIGKMMADALGIPIYDRSLIEMAAQESGISSEILKQHDEASSGGLKGMALRAMAAVPFVTADSFSSNSISDENLFNIQCHIIQEKAEKENCIIVGRCADYILRNHPRLLRIFIRANIEDRIKFFQDREIIGREDAEKQLRKIEKKRAAYHDFFSETTWGDSRSYDLCVNSSILGKEKTAEFLIQYAKAALNIE